MITLNAQCFKNNRNHGFKTLERHYQFDLRSKGQRNYNRDIMMLQEDQIVMNADEFDVYRYNSGKTAGDHKGHFLRSIDLVEIQSQAFFTVARNAHCRDDNIVCDNGM